MSVLTPNMPLQLPTINVDSGLLWEQAFNNNATILANHDHSPSNGVQIQPNGLNINGDLTFANNSAINLKAAIFTPQTSFATIRSLYTIASDLYYNDGASNVVRITSGGTVNATSSGISSGTATASFVGPVLVVNAAANTPADIKGGSIFLGNNVAASKFLKLSPPAAMAADYSLILPPLPASQKFLTLDSSGNMAASWAVDNSTLEINSNTLRVKSSGITTTQLAADAVFTVNILDGAVTKPKLAALGQQISSSSGIQFNNSTTVTDIPNLSVTITTSGRPVVVMMIGDGTTSLSYIGATISSGTSNAMIGNFFFFRGATRIYFSKVECTNTSTWALNSAVSAPTSSMSYIDIVGAGTYTYKVSFSSNSANVSAFCQDAKLIAYEL